MEDPSTSVLFKAAKTYEKILRLKDPPEKLRDQPDGESTIQLLHSVKTYHDLVHAFDDSCRSDFISELTIEGMHDEQVWQQQELQLDALKRFISEKSSFFTTAEQAPFTLRLSGKSKKTISGKQNETVALEADSDDSDENIGSDVDSAKGSEESDAELASIKERLKSRDHDGFDIFGDDDSEDETLFKGGEEEEEESNDDENDFDFDLPKIGSKESIPQKQETVKRKPFKRKTEVDDKFFKLADMEEYVEQIEREEEKKLKQSGGKEDSDDNDSSEESDDETQNIDMFAEWSDDETGKEAMYSDFFDPPPDDAESEKTLEQISGEEEDGDEYHDDDDDDDDDMSSDEEQTRSSKKKVRFSINDKMSGDDGAEQLSVFEKRSEKLSQHMSTLEEKSLETKPWQLSGEVGSSKRPENSMLEEHLSFKQTAPLGAEITEEVTLSIEERIMQRVKDKAFDDNQRQVRPKEEAFELMTQKTLDQEKSKLSLHEVYEQEFLKLQAPEEEATNPLHDEIKKMMAHLFPRLDALASWHYTPTQAVPEIKIKNNLPAIQMEEATPITMATSSLLAPEEIQAKKKGEMKGKTERTKEDKTRERKQKKSAKRRKMKEKEQRQKEVEKQNPGLGNKYSKERALKELEKQSAGTVEVIKDKKSKKSMSSKAFFTQLQEEVTTQRVDKTQRKKQKKKSSDKYLL